MAEKSFANTEENCVITIEKYLNSTHSLQGKFEQLGPGRDEVKLGEFFLSKPNKMRWEYNSPKKISISILGEKVTYHDHEMQEISNVYNKNAIFKLLAKDKISLRDEKEFSITSCSKNTQYIELNLINKEKDGVRNNILLHFTLAPKVQLKKISLVENESSSKTDIIFSQINQNIKLTDETFIIEDKGFLELNEDR